MKLASCTQGFDKMDEGKEEPEEQGKSDEQVKTLEEALESEKKRSEEYLTQLKYARADLENMKKRFDRQLEDLEKHSNERIITGLLDVVDELEMAVKSARSFSTTENLVQGVEMTLKKLNKMLENEGVTPIKSVGEPFNPEKHHAVERTEKEGVEGVTITEEIRKGYMRRDKVIRPSIVKVEVPPSQSQKENNSNE
jgi:molecular chaperone GrpE